jgi:diguanylate cyclase (GGDEF)-like protein
MALREPDRPLETNVGQRLRTGLPVQRQVAVTVSIGIAERDDKLTTPDEVLKAADRALYRAKDKGRNQVSR